MVGRVHGGKEASPRRGGPRASLSPNSAIEMRVASAKVQVHGGTTLSLGRGGPRASLSDSQAKPAESSRCPRGPRPTGKARWGPTPPLGLPPPDQVRGRRLPKSLMGEDRLSQKRLPIGLSELRPCPIAGFGGLPRSLPGTRHFPRGSAPRAPASGGPLPPKGGEASSPHPSVCCPSPASIENRSLGQHTRL